ncbi:unnamed protein product [Gemmata massiliana]|uniref:Uncharacterized protein n=1 Tax=Gemmata massiliana TaxID=1210884 RepID=A0A6P2DI15_9BACT|nr:unnamed protein product [Gemmata massiliana]
MLAKVRHSPRLSRSRLLADLTSFASASFTVLFAALKNKNYPGQGSKFVAWATHFPRKIFEERCSGPVPIPVRYCVASRTGASIGDPL